MATNDPPWAQQLTLLLDRAWQCLADGAHTRDAAARYPTLATISDAGRPQARTVVLREANRARGQLAVYSDVHAGKVRELRAHPRASLHVWDAAQRLQLRIAATATVTTGDDVQARWQPLPDHGRAAYGHQPTSGTSIPDALAYTTTASREAFAVLAFRIESLEALHLGEHHRRALFERGDDWAGQWVVP
ncbi:pyridoxamine 5'-phosphate oxidase family protein [Vreelandella malpeensis]|uniref:Pyridoxamine 5'-phosphate oxidase family protein n=1 Tax=Vreelandella malpeensis TaxID=1172368 RepID=A0ABS8DN83_9GAMM|nr:pyridoxamine 5'-phosphate oxidase family protein [Halomonas malpeensis]MCB8887610.1 pyridoxamine 5'-phosphate oxidase family protein [Halomonas malpeensis]